MSDSNNAPQENKNHVFLIAEMLTDDPDTILDLKQYLKSKLPQSSNTNKLLTWAFSKSKFTDPSAQDDAEKIKIELDQGLRLVSNPWSNNINIEDFDGYHIIDYGNQLMISLPENKDIVELITSTEGTASHIVRGLAFGYNPLMVKRYYDSKKIGDNWNDFLRALGIKLHEDYPGGYASVARIRGSNFTGSIIIDPKDINTMSKFWEVASQNNIKLIKAQKYCDECNSYVHLEGVPPEHHNMNRKEAYLLKDECPHDNKEAFFLEFDFDLRETESL